MTTLGDDFPASNLRGLPVESARIPAPFTPRGWLGDRSEGHRLHAGVDLGHARAVVVAPEACFVELVADASYAEEEPRYSSPTGWSGYGPRAVVVGGASGVWHLLAHLGNVAVRPGDILGRGDVIGDVSPRGSHVHWEVREHVRPPRDVATVEIALDPIAWLDGRREPWPPSVCPLRPTDDERTPRACRPGTTSRPTEIPAEGERAAPRPTEAPSHERDGARARRGVGDRQASG